jgi:pyruvate/2-oxoglutarate dehydrogenase complex dihydrolipoamide dehydrogenase (E3) component
MAQPLTPDICVIGAGSAGVAAASAAAAFGVPVVLIANGRLGDESRNAATASTKVLAAAAERVHAVRNGGCFGLQAARFGVDFAAIGERVREVADVLAGNDTRPRLAALGVRVMEGEARFADPRTVVADDVTVAARRFVIATGTAPALPPIPGLADTPHLTTDTMSDLAACPRHLIVIGAGASGIALAQAFRRLGAAVTVLDSAAPLSGSDPECAAIVLDALAQEGVTLRTGVEIAQVHRDLARIVVEIKTPAGRDTIEGSHLLVVAGRRPNVESLALDAAGIRYQPDGIVIDSRLRTSNKRVYAIGDVTVAAGSHHLGHHHAELVVRHAVFRQRVAVDAGIIPAVTFTDPELAQVGMLETEAREHAGAIRVLRWPYRNNHRARIEQATKGHIKIVTDRRGDILGVTIVGAEAGEAIAAWALAIGQKLNIGAMAGLVVPYPSYGEVGKRAAMTYFMRGLTSSRVRRIIGWLRRLG